MKEKRKFILGIAGKPACGKTTTAKILGEFGFKILNLDEEGHKALLKKTDEVSKIFGPQILKNGIPDRKAIADIVFKNPEMLKELEAVLHPEIKKRVIEKIKGGGKFAIDGAVLEKIGLRNICNAVLWIECDKATAFERAKSRNWNAKDFEMRWNAVPEIAGENVFKVKNDRDVDELREEIFKILKHLKAI